MLSIIKKLKNYIYFTIYLILNPRLIILGLKHKIYIPVYVQYEWLNKYQVDTIIDVGAHKGRVSQSLKHIFPKAKIYAFEPDRTHHAAIKRRLGRKKVVIESYALSDSEGKTNFNKYSDSTLSTLMPLITPGIRDGVKINLNHTTVPTTTLDKYFSSKRHLGKILLKIDTEGAEAMILSGAKKFLEKVSIIHVETYFKKIYKGQSLFESLYATLRSHGFKYAGEAREANFYPDFNLPTIANSVFIKKAASVPSRKNS